MAILFHEFFSPQPNFVILTPYSVMLLFTTLHVAFMLVSNGQLGRQNRVAQMVNNYHHTQP